MIHSTCPLRQILFDIRVILLRCHEQEPQAALELFRVLRSQTYHLIRALPEPIRSNKIDYPENGWGTLKDPLGVDARHVPNHVRQMRAIHAAWPNRDA